MATTTTTKRPTAKPAATKDAKTKTTAPAKAADPQCKVGLAANG